MELNLDLEIKDMYGGDGVIRIEQIKKPISSKKRGKKTTRTSSVRNVSSEEETKEELFETKDDPVQTFKFDEDGNPIYKLGGIHGKFWGHLRACGKMLADIGDEDFKSKAFVDRMMMAVNITPMNVVIKDHEAIQKTKIPQLLNTAGNTMQFITFDYIPKCKVNLKMVFPDIYKSQIIKLLKQSETVFGLNKRRASITVINRKILGS